MGVDRTGNLWAWNQPEKVLRVVSPDGRILNHLTLEGVARLDFDPDLGIAALLPSHRQVVVIDLRGTVVHRLDLEDEAGDLCWVGTERIAVSPSRTPRRVEIWNPEEKGRVASFGEEQELENRAGVTRLRHVLLRYDFAHDRLWTLDTYLGSFRVFSVAGSELFSTTVETNGRQELEEWLHKNDTEARRIGEARSVRFAAWPSMALARNGAAWIIESCRDENEDTILDHTPGDRDVPGRHRGRRRVVSGRRFGT